MGFIERLNLPKLEEVMRFFAVKKETEAVR